jgi:hypothetical protein
MAAGASCEKIGSILIPEYQGRKRPVIPCLEVEPILSIFFLNAYNLHRESNYDQQNVAALQVAGKRPV